MTDNWSIEDSRELYNIGHWGIPYFSINEHGNITVSPTGSDGGSIDLKNLIDDLCRRGIEPPILVRFNDIIHARLRYITDAFRHSIKEYSYKNDYRSVMPIKVNQQRHVVEELVRCDPPYKPGLEAGSKPELLAAIAMLDEDNPLMVCNGYKDQEYIETVLGAQRLGLSPYLVVDRFAELEPIITAARKLDIVPTIGLRARLSTRGSGRWARSSGHNSKFGLSSREIVLCVKRLEECGMLDSLRLLHFHIGSQITSIRSVKDAVREAAHLYSHLRQMGCNKLDTIDVGGGLAVDYDGSQTNFHSSRNYSIQEYANDIVGTLGDICDLTSVPHPAILSESGRAIVAHHSVLVFNVLGAQNHQNALAACPTQANESDHRVIVDLLEAYRSVNQRNVQEVFHDLLALREESSTLFSHGVLDLETRARCEELFLAAAERIQQTIQTLDYVPDELQGIDKLIGDTFFCNFSIFQSLPDAWAVGHLFPIIPIHRLAERPTRDAVLADLTCDSDGKIDKFIDLRDVRDTLKLHTLNSEPYYLGAFLVGAYQETLGDLHNLFGDTNAVHVSISSDGSYSLEHLVKGDSVCDVLSYVEYDRGDLLRRTRLLAERSVRRKRMTLEESADFMKQYEAGLDGYTYLEEAED